MSATDIEAAVNAAVGEYAKGRSGQVVNFGELVAVAVLAGFAALEDG